VPSAPAVSVARRPAVSTRVTQTASTPGVTTPGVTTQVVTTGAPQPTDLPGLFATRFAIRAAGVAAALGVVYLLLWLGRTFGDGVPSALPGLLLLVIVVVGAPLLLFYRLRRLARRLFGSARE
jgi:hypothetical protein